jgi:NAD(P)H-dependent flavin oxidoreductase YrpB (nitropropane dioxygenase family)
MHEHLDPVRSPVGKEVGMVRTRLTEHLDHTRQRRLCSRAHVQRLDRKWVFRTNVTGRFGIVTARFGST